MIRIISIKHLYTVSKISMADRPFTGKNVSEANKMLTSLLNRNHPQSYLLKKLAMCCCYFFYLIIFLSRINLQKPFNLRIRNTNRLQLNYRVMWIAIFFIWTS